MRSAQPLNRVTAIALILLQASYSLGQAQRKPTQSEPVKKSQSAATEAARPKEDRQDQAIKLEATLVTVPVIASDRDGRYVPDMRREDFSILEDGVKQEIVFFATVDEPFHVVLMLDTSASTQEKLGQIQSAANAFLSQLKSEDRVKVISFDDSIHNLCDFTNDRGELRRAIDQTRPGQGTKLYDAVTLALRELRPIKGRKSIVLFTDGVDMHSDTSTYDDNINAVEESGTIVYPIRYDTRADTEALLRRQGGLGGIISRPPVGTTPTNVPGGDRAPRFPPSGPTVGDPRIPPVGPPVGFPSPGNIPYPGGRRPDNRFPDGRYPQDNRYPDSRYPQDNRYPPDGSIPEPQPYPRRNDPVRGELDVLYGIADRYLNELSIKSGGKLSRADNLQSLPSAFAQIAAELRTQYALGYYPSNASKDGSYRKIQVRTSRKNVAIRARPGYRAPAGS
jgi:Mg-chelatase subunit ChlD